MPVKHIQEIHASEVPDSADVFKKVLLASDETPNFEMRCFIIQPGGRMPKHTNRVEHEQFVLQGHGRVGIGDEIFEVKRGNIVFISAEVPHWYENIGDETFEFLCMVPNQPDKVTIIK